MAPIAFGIFIQFRLLMDDDTTRFSLNGSQQVMMWYRLGYRATYWGTIVGISKYCPKIMTRYSFYIGNIWFNIPKKNHILNENGNKNCFFKKFCWSV